MSTTKQITKIFLWAACLPAASISHAQYFQYSQYNFTEQRVNPAMAGMSRYASASLDFRNQKTGGDFPINSTYLELNYPLLISSTGQPWSGIGLSFHDDRSGGMYKTEQVALSYAIHLHIARYQMLSFGAKLLYQVMQVSFDGLYTGSQYIPDRGFDLSAESGENLSGYRQSLSTFSMGFYWQETDKNGRLLHHFGLSLFDINRPPDSFFGNSGVLSSTMVLHGGFQAYSASNFHIFPEALFTYSASNALLNAGLRFQKELNPMPNQASDRIELLTKYAVGRSGIVGIQLHRENFSMGLSYDFPLVRTNAGNLGALEVGITVRKLVSTRVQKQMARRKKAVEERKKASAKKRPVNTNKTILQVATKTSPQIKPTSPVVPVEVYVDSTTAKTIPQSTTETIAEAGKLKQDPLVIEKVTLHFGFEFNSADLDDSSEDYINQLVIMLEENKSVKVHIVGYTDNVGPQHFNLRLSQKRADRVKSALLKKGIAPERIISEGRGMENPLNDNLTDEDRSKNRRVEITLHY